MPARCRQCAVVWVGRHTRHTSELSVAYTDTKYVVHLYETHDTRVSLLYTSCVVHFYYSARTHTQCVGCVNTRDGDKHTRHISSTLSVVCSMSSLSLSLMMIDVSDARYRRVVSRVSYLSLARPGAAGYTPFEERGGRAPSTKYTSNHDTYRLPVSLGAREDHGRTRSRSSPKRKQLITRQLTVQAQPQWVPRLHRQNHHPTRLAVPRLRPRLLLRRAEGTHGRGPLRSSVCACAFAFARAHMCVHKTCAARLLLFVLFLLEALRDALLVGRLR